MLRGNETEPLLSVRDGIRADLLAAIPELFEEGPRELYQLMWYADGYIQVISMNARYPLHMVPVARQESCVGDEKEFWRIPLRSWRAHRNQLAQRG